MSSSSSSTSPTSSSPTNAGSSSGGAGLGGGGPIGSGLIEITALTALIGSPTAEQLTLGDRGAAGLSWVGMSMFGTLSILKSCIAASSPTWLRETLGVRNAATDGAVGLGLDLSSAYLDREDMARKSMKNAVGVTCESRKRHSPNNPLFRIWKRPNSGDSETVHTQRDIYAFDQFTLNALGPIPSFQSGTGTLPQVAIFQGDPHYRGYLTRRDWIGLLSTLGKVIELYVLYFLGAGLLTWMAGLNWFYFFTAALVMQSMGLSRGYRRDFETNGRCDIIAGQLPSTRSPAGACKILLGVPGNFRRHILWRIVWFFGIVVCSVSVVGCYMLLSAAGPMPAYAWIGFQVFWLVCRSIFYHVSEAASKDIYPTQKGQKWDNLNQSMRRRVLKLLMTLNKYQIHVQPRGSYCYTEDIASVEEARDLLARCTFVEEYPLDLLHPVEEVTTAANSRSTSTDNSLSTSYPPILGNRSVDIKVQAMMGDTLLSSAAWFCGSKHAPIELYDTSIIFIEVPPGSAGDKSHLIAVPAVRVLGAAPDETLSKPRPPDLETVGRDMLDEEIRFTSPKGSSNMGLHDVMWVMFIPCGRGQWTEATSVGMKVLGGPPRRASVLTDEQLTQRLDSGYWNVSLEKADMAYDTLALSRKTAEMVVDLFGTGLGISVDRQLKAR